jgi:hypothetical protein
MPENRNKSLTLKTIRSTTFPDLPFKITRLVDNLWVPVDLTDASIKMDIRVVPYGPISQRLSSPSNGITITDAIEGEFKINKQIFTLAPNNYYFDIMIIFPDGTVKIFVEGRFEVIKNITENE